VVTGAYFPTGHVHFDPSCRAAVCDQGVQGPFGLTVKWQNNTFNNSFLIIWSANYIDIRMLKKCKGRQGLKTISQIPLEQGAVVKHGMDASHVVVGAENPLFVKQDGVELDGKSHRRVITTRSSPSKNTQASTTTSARGLRVLWWRCDGGRLPAPRSDFDLSIRCG
jgi:hypothetical protein